jgi:hypothetical protein
MKLFLAILFLAIFLGSIITWIIFFSILRKDNTELIEDDEDFQIF